MGLFSKTQEQQLVTYYASEDGLHPRLAAAFKWYEDEVLVHLAKNSRDKAILAGGALRSFFTDAPVRDFDMYREDKIFLQLEHEWRKISETDRSSVMRKVIFDPSQKKLLDVLFNVVKKSYSSPQDVINDFDLTVCMCAITKDQITYHPDYFTDLATRTLRLNDLEDPLSTLWRVQKYNKLGYSMDKSDMYKLAEAIHDLDSLPRDSAVSLDKEMPSLEEIFRSS